MDNNQKIDLNHLAVFNKIAESQSLTAAAKLLKQDKARLSRILAELEEAFGTKLIHRTTRQFQLTEMGMKLYREFTPALLSLRQTTSELLSKDGELHGHIRLTGAHGLFARMISPILAEFTQAHPKVTFDLVFAQQSLDLVKEGIDLAVRMGQPKDSSMIIQKIGDFSACFVASPFYIKKHSRFSFETLNQCRLLMLESLNNKLLKIINGEESKQIKLKGFVTCNGPDVLLDMTLQGVGVSLLPEMFIRDHIKSGALVRLFPGWITEPMPAVLLHTYGKRSMPPHIQAFSDFLVKKMREQIN